MKRILAAFALSAGVVIMSMGVATAEPRAFNGLWTVQLVTESGLCSRYSYAVAIQNGSVRLASGGDAASITGQIARNGKVGLSIQNSMASGTASGRLWANAGAGTWQVSSLCSGRWTARRHAGPVAQAL